MVGAKVKASYITQAELDPTGYGQACLVIGNRKTNSGKNTFQAALLLPGNADHNDRGGLRQGYLNAAPNGFQWMKQLSARRMFKATECTEPYLFLEGKYQDLIIFFKDMERPDHQAWISNLLPLAPKQRTAPFLEEKLRATPTLPVRPGPFDPFEL